MYLIKWFITNFLYYKNKKAKKEEETPKIAPPITSVDQCSPKVTLDKSIKKLKIERALIKISLPIFSFLSLRLDIQLKKRQKQFSLSDQMDRNI